MSDSLDLSRISTQDLEQFLALLDSPTETEGAAPMTVAQLQSVGLGHLSNGLMPFLSLGVAAVRLAVSAVLVERRQRPGPKLDLVWTGVDAGVSLARYTTVVVPELFGRAEKHVLIAGYSFDSGATIFAPLHQVMQTRGVQAELFVDIDQLYQRLRAAVRSERLDLGLLCKPIEGAVTSASRAEAVLELFARLFWPFGEPYPAIYYDPRTAEKSGNVSLHAKCLVIDHRYSLITSANFTDRGQNRNTEAGVAIEDDGFAAALEQQWLNLINAGLVQAWQR